MSSTRYIVINNWVAVPSDFRTLHQDLWWKNKKIIIDLFNNNNYQIVWWDNINDLTEWTQQLVDSALSHYNNRQNYIKIPDQVQIGSLVDDIVDNTELVAFETDFSNAFSSIRAINNQLADSILDLKYLIVNNDNHIYTKAANDLKSLIFDCKDLRTLVHVANFDIHESGMHWSYKHILTLHIINKIDEYVKIFNESELWKTTIWKIAFFRDWMLVFWNLSSYLHDNEQEQCSLKIKLLKDHLLNAYNESDENIKKFVQSEYSIVLRLIEQDD
jgi:hypothetical protein